MSRHARQQARASQRRGADLTIRGCSLAPSEVVLGGLAWQSFEDLPCRWAVPLTGPAATGAAVQLDFLNVVHGRENARPAASVVLGLLVPAALIWGGAVRSEEDRLVVIGFDPHRSVRIANLSIGAAVAFGRRSPERASEMASDDSRRGSLVSALRLASGVPWRTPPNPCNHGSPFSIASGHFIRNCAEDLCADPGQGLCRLV